MKNTFITPVSMKVTEEQYERDLKQPLIDLGYEEGLSFDEFRPVLFTNHTEPHVINSLYFNSIKRFGCHFIDHYNPELFLALAAMTDGEEWIIGEYLIYKHDNSVFRVHSFDGHDSNQGLANNGSMARNIYRKSTKQEIINHFTSFVMPETNKHVLKQETMENRFPFKLSNRNAQRIIDIACSTWKSKLADKWAKNMILGQDNEIDETFYKMMRKECDDPQNELFDGIFGKDQEFPKDGTPCLVRDFDNTGWCLRYANGKGKFYRNGCKSGAIENWSEWQILDINNLPVNE